MVIQKNSKKDNIIRYNGNNSMFGGGPVANQQLSLNLPYGIAINNAGFVFVADSENHCIRIFSPNPYYTLIYTLGSSGNLGNINNTFNRPAGISIHRFGDEDILYVADMDNHRIQVFRININEVDNTITSTHLPGANGSPHSIGRGIAGNTNNTFTFPMRIAIDNDILYVADSGNHRIQVFRITINDNNTITAIHLPGANGSPHSIGTGVFNNTKYTFNNPEGLAIHRFNDEYILYVADRYNCRIQVFRITINANDTITAIHLAGANGGPHSIGTGRSGNTNYTFSSPYVLAIANDILYIADSGNHRIQVFRITIDANDTITAIHLPGANGSPHSIGTGVRSNTNNTFAFPTGLAIHRHNDQNILYVADLYNGRIQIFYGDITNPATLQYYDSIPSPPPKYTILTQNRMIPLDIRNTRCMFCNFTICTPTPHNPNNNVNGYVIKLDTDPAQPRFFHYTCIYNYITSNSAIDIHEFGISHRDTHRLINDNRDNNNFDGTDFFIPDFIILNRETDVPANSRDTPCRLCGNMICTRVIHTNNNLNGYVLHLHNLTNPNTYYYHYKCISKYFIQIIGTDSPYKSPHCATIMDRHDIDKLLNIDRKADAVNGNGFY
jgi:sugar lactone lactonase YvrE